METKRTSNKHKPLKTTVVSQSHHFIATLGAIDNQIELDSVVQNKGVDEPYQTGLSAKNGKGMKRNMRSAFFLVQKSSENGHTEAKSELSECYKLGKGCERDLNRAVELGNTKAMLGLGMKMNREGRESECTGYFWMALEAGESEAVFQLAETYRNGEMVEKDNEESEGLLEEEADTMHFEKSEEEIEWNYNEAAKTLFAGVMTQSARIHSKSATRATLKHWCCATDLIPLDPMYLPITRFGMGENPRERDFNRKPCTQALQSPSNNQHLQNESYVLNGGWHFILQGENHCTRVPKGI